ncbi:TetR/AcrR family transcriptional regulator [Noviherbaspirillum galbum]|uniref:TetR/AcrR family transcriptional regulator n=1 Tax=Noviherbaspirillum galbum TaxID=2709383 RepID=A0A6B3SSU9_9BURK|nr:TetR/AcrR family transcriptional regulator [Noviherbaspirillum galbum]NEX63734.1 TetR/AcrR family transcriptional regulator [Noviherbaspirillum galbum]
MDQKLDTNEARKARRNARAERRTVDPAVPRERILNVAASLFRQRGYNGTTVRDIAAEVGILSGSLFHHFQSKEEILLEIMREAAFTICVRAEKTLEDAETPWQQLRELVRLELESIVGGVRKDYHAVLFFEWRDLPEAAKPELTRLQKRYNRSWRQAAEACHAAGLLRCEPDAAVLILHGSVRGAMTWFRPGGRYSTDEFGDILTALVAIDIKDNGKDNHKGSKP